MFDYYRPRSEASEGYVFTGVRHSVTEGGGEGGVNQGPGHNTSLPPWAQVTTPRSPLGTGHNTSLPPAPPLGTGHSTSLPLPLGTGHYTSPLPWTQVTTPASPPGHRSQHLPSIPPGTWSQHLPLWAQVTTPPPLGTGHNISLPSWA